MARFDSALSLSRCLAVSLVSVLIVSTASGQITNVTGDQAPPVEGAGHDYIQMLNETVNPATGFVSLRVSVPAPPGRGLTIPFAFGYNSNAALHFTPNSWKNNSGYVGQQGWSYLLPQLNWGENAITNVNAQGQVTSVCIFYLDYMLTDISGGSHPLYLFVLQPLNSAI